MPRSRHRLSPPTASTADPERIGARDHARGAAAAAIVTVVWVVLAARRPTVTYHAAPLLAAAAWPFVLRGRAAIRVARADSRVGAIGGAAIAAAAAAALLATDRLRGPTLWGSGAAIIEIVPAIVIGAVVGHRWARCGAPGR